MKYVIVKIICCEVPIIFPDNVSHETFKNMKPIAAGKFSISFNLNNGKKVYNVCKKSTSLKLGSRPEDADIIKHAFEFEG